MLHPDWTYVSFDFETTGLDVTKDEPIQLGIVRFDHEGNVIDTFCSCIKPKKPIKELKSIVRFIT
jgi:DNA polymerase III alpha subunit (gram-positive type)